RTESTLEDWQPEGLCYTHLSLAETLFPPITTINEEHVMGINDKPYSEKRDFIRMRIGAPLNAKLASSEDIIEGLCLDLSGGWLQVEAEQHLPTGTEVVVEVSSGLGHNPTLQARARFVRALPSESGKHLLGLEII